MSRAFVFVKVKNKTGIRKLNVPYVKRAKSTFSVKRISKKPFFIVPAIKISKREMEINEIKKSL